MSLTGLNDSEFSSISVSNQIRLGISANNGDDGQFVKSDGENASWSDISSTDVLQAGTGISINTTTSPDTISTNVKSLVLSGTAVQDTPQTFNPNADGGSQTITINDTNTTYQGSATIDIDTSTDPDTISCLKVPNQLTASTPLTLTGGYDGSSARSLTISNIANSDLQNSTISGVALGGNLANLTQGTNITFSSGTTYNGSSAITINSTDTNTTYQGDGSTISIDTATDPDTISCLKVPNVLTQGTNITFSSGTTYDGSSAITINSTDTNTEYTAGTGLDLTAEEFSTSASLIAGLDFSAITDDPSTISDGQLYRAEVSDGDGGTIPVLAIKQS